MPGAGTFDEADFDPAAVVAAYADHRRESITQLAAHLVKLCEPCHHMTAPYIDLRYGFRLEALEVHLYISSAAFPVIAPAMTMKNMTTTTTIALRKSLNLIQARP
jgi:hypothetical protein